MRWITLVAISALLTACGSTENFAPVYDIQNARPVKSVTRPRPTGSPRVVKSQLLKLGGNETAVAGWVWPAHGRIIATYSQSTKGINIAGEAGDPVLAATDGVVAYSGNGLRGYGNLIIIKHNNKYLSAYAHLKAILVKNGQAVRAGQKIAEMGRSDSDKVMLHFEIRQNGKPIDPFSLYA